MDEMRFMKTIITSIACFLFTFMLSACKISLPILELGGLYNRSAKYHDQYRNPIIVIPGILGSRLKQEGTDTLIWGAFGGQGSQPP